MNIPEKRGVSPVIATVLLVVIALILAIIIFFWARSFVAEKIEKDGRDIDQSCAEVSFRAEVVLSEGNLAIENTGSVPLYGAEIRKKQFIGEIKKVATFDSTVRAGETGYIELDDIIEELEVGNELIVVPVLLGETEQYKKAHVCDKEYGVETIVK